MAISRQIKEDYAELCNPPQGADAIWKRSRGFKFEVLLADLLRADRLDPRTSYKASGEQIDGSFFLDGTVFLLEAKWHTNEIPASTLYQFKGKVDGKLSGTLGVFISMSGYSRDAVDALTLGKSLNLILFDKKDLDAAIDKDLGFREVLKRKLRKAAEEGVVYFPMEVDLVTRSDSTQVEIEQFGFDAVTGAFFSQVAPTSMAADLVILCEGNSDRLLIARIVKRILMEAGSGRRVKIAAAMGKYSMPKLANALHENLNVNTKMLIVIDGDDNTEMSLEMLERNIGFTGWMASIPSPEIEVWLGLDRTQLQGLSPFKRLQRILELADQFDIEGLRSRDKSFSDFYNAVIGAN